VDPSSTDPPGPDIEAEALVDAWFEEMKTFDPDGLDAAEVAADPELPERLDSMRKRFLDREQIRSLPPPEWLIEGFLVSGTLAWLGGPFNSGKSFLAIDWACCVATGRDWRGHSLIGGGGPVIMLTAEGSSGLDQRLEAWEQANGMEAPVTAYPWSIASVVRDRQNFAMSQDWEDFVRCCAELKPRLVTLDTQAQITVGLNENLPAEMSHYVEAVKHLQIETGATVLTVHHGKEQLRGATSVPGAADSIAMLTLAKPPARSGKPKHVQLTSLKMKDAEDFKPLDFSLVPLGRSAVLVDGAPEWVSKARIAGTDSDFDHGDGLADVLHIDPLTPMLKNLAKLRAVYEVGEHFTRDEAATVLAIRPSNVARALKPMLEKHWVGTTGTTTGKVYYLHPEPPPPPEQPDEDDSYDFVLDPGDSPHHPKSEIDEEDPEYDL
jgi:hypothetical protein